MLDDLDDDIQVLVSWIAVKSTDLEAVARVLGLRDCKNGNIDDIFPIRAINQREEKGIALFPLVMNGQSYYTIPSSILNLMKTTYSQRSA